MLVEHLKMNQLYYFKNLKTLIQENEIAIKNIPVDEFISAFNEVINHFKSRFNDFHQIKTLITMVSVPQSIDVSEVPIELQLEIIELKNSSILINQFIQGENL